jgi:hypothetical protein
MAMIPAYSPQARGTGERNFGTWPGRLPQELRIHGLRSMASANQFLRETYLPGFNQRFAVAAAQPGHAFLPVRGKNLDLIFILAARAHREPGQPRAHRSVCSANREVPLQSHASRVSGHDLPTARWHLEHRLGPAPAGALQPARNSRAASNASAP